MAQPCDVLIHVVPPPYTEKLSIIFLLPDRILPPIPPHQNTSRTSLGARLDPMIFRAVMWPTVALLVIPPVPSVTPRVAEELVEPRVSTDVVPHQVFVVFAAAANPLVVLRVVSNGGLRPVRGRVIVDPVGALGPGLGPLVAGLLLGPAAGLGGAVAVVRGHRKQGGDLRLRLKAMKLD